MFGGAEGGRGLRGDGHGLAGFGVEGLAGGSGFGLEGAEFSDVDRLALFQVARDEVEDGPDERDADGVFHAQERGELARDGGGGGDGVR